MSEQDKNTKDPSGKILSLVSHKLKTPLSIINGYSEAILSQAGKEKFSPFAAKALEEINKQGLKMSELVDKLLTYNKVSRMSEKDLKKTSVHLKALAKECAGAAIAKDDDSVAASSAEPTAKRGTYIEIDCSESLTINADKEILKAMLEEMLDNAIKFNNKMEKIIKVQGANHGDSISISVRDYGAGIRPQDVPHIFDPFYQVDDYFTGQINGWGLGLAMIKRGAELHGGTVNVVSDRGLGSIFTITIPIQ